MRKEIENRQDIEKLVETFYPRVKQDDVIGYIFNKKSNMVWETHIPVMYNFWDTILLGAQNYHGGVMFKHIQLDKKEPLTADHFSRWKNLFHGTVDEVFVGDHADEAKRWVEMMEKLMLFKIEQSRKPGFIQ